MRKKILQPQKKYISRVKSCQILKLSDEDFGRAAALLNIRPVRPKQKQCLDYLDKVYYRMSDIRRVINTQVYLDICRQNRLARKRAEYRDLKRYRRDIGLNYDDLVRERYATFSEALADVASSLMVLYVKRRNCELEMRRDLARVKNEIVVSGDGCSHTIDEKVRRMRAGPDAGDAPRWETSPQELYLLTANFHRQLRKDFPLRRAYIGKDGFYLSSHIVNGNFEWFVPFRFEEKKENGMLNVLYPLCLSHVSSVLEHLREYECAENRRAESTKQNLSGMTFRLDTFYYAEVYDLVVFSCGGTVSDTDYKYVITDHDVDEMEAQLVYLQPQFIFDALNLDSRPEVADYVVGRQLPTHISPFRTIKIAGIDENELLTLRQTDKRLLGHGE